MLKLARGTDLKSASAPLLVIYLPEDEVVSPTFTEQVFPRSSAAVKESGILQNSDDPANHVIVGTSFRPSDCGPKTTTPLTKQRCRLVNRFQKGA